LIFFAIKKLKHNSVHLLYSVEKKFMPKRHSPEGLPVGNHVLRECLARDLDVQLAPVEIRINQIAAGQMILRVGVQISSRQKTRST
jgi:hypothetical protein